MHFVSACFAHGRRTGSPTPRTTPTRSEEHTSELQSHVNFVCRLLLEKKNRFVGEFTILLGAFGSLAINNPWFAVISALGVIMAAVYILYMFQNMFLGPQGPIADEVKQQGHALRDLNWREIATIVPLLIFIFWIGLYPMLFFFNVTATTEIYTLSYTTLFR